MNPRVPNGTSVERSADARHRNHRAGARQIEEFVTNTEITGLDILFAVLVLIGAWLLSKVTRRVLNRLLGRVEGIPDDAKQLVARIAGYVVVTLGVAYALSLLGADVAPLLTVVLVVVVVLALALRGVAENFDEQPERRDPDGGRTSGPLAQHQAARRACGQSHDPWRSPVELAVQIIGSVDVDSVVGRIRTAMEDVGEVRTDPAPSLAVVAIGIDRVNLAMRFWHGPSDDAATISAVATDVARALRASELQFILGTPGQSPVAPAPSVPPGPLLTSTGMTSVRRFIPIG